MPRFPFTANLSAARAYYGPSLTDPRDQPEYWSDYPQIPARSASKQFSNFASFIAGIGGVAALGYVPFRGQHIWDYYVKGLRAVEEYSPAKIFRTFQLSPIFSGFETSVRQANLFVGPELLKANRQQAEYLSRLIGGDAYSRLLKEGVTLRSGRLFWGQGPNIALKYASAIRTAGLGEASNIGAAYARRLGLRELRGTPPFERFFAAAAPLKDRYPDILNPLIEGYPAQIIGGKNIFQHTWRKLGALGTEQISRFNRLLTMFPIIGKRLAVKPGGGLSMLGRFTAKFGLGLGALSLGYEYLDWKARQSKILDETRFSEGITYGLATIPAEAHIKAAEISESLGLSDYARKQEEIAPGSTSLLKLAAFPMMGAFGVGALSYFGKIGGMARLQISEGISSSMARHRMEEAFKSWGRFGTFGENIGRVLESKSGGLLGRFVKKISTPTKFGMAIGAGIGLAAILPFLPGALFPQTSPEELRDIYSGKQEVPVRKGRWWLFGRSPAEGQNIQYFRPHWIPMLKQQGREKVIWGEKDLEKFSPVERWYKQEFTYEMEKRHPYFPVSSLPFEDIPFLGPVLSATVGRWIKPELYLNTEHWLSDKGIKTQPPSFGARVAVEAGQIPQGIPVSPYSVQSIIGEQIYRVGTEMIGLTGFATAAIKEKITGSQDWFDQLAQLESARRVFGIERWYWEKELGDPFGLTEPIRRLFPHRRRQLDLINPIPSNAPEWLPGPGEKAPDFSTGYYYNKVPMGEIRLPGLGYSERFPELKGVEPSDYPLIHQFKILADVSPYSDKYKQSLQKIRVKRASKDWGDYEEDIFQATLKQVKQKKQRVEFQEYKYLSSMGEVFPGAKQESSELIAKMNEWKASQEEKPSLFKRLFGGYWELLAHNAETAFDQLTPISPGAKLVHVRSPTESYEREILYGSQAAFWQHPVSHFLAPFARSMAHTFGYEGIPEKAQTTRDLESYFDILKYVKNARLSNLARMAGDTEAVKEFERNKDETLFGINPFTRNYSSLYRALPRRERDYFSAFENADTLEERQRILEMVPENEKSLYIARWKLVHAADLKKAVKAGIFSEAEEAEADKKIDAIFKEARTEGFPMSDDLFAEYLKTKYPGENYGDWYRRVKILSGIEGIPGPDFVGFSPSVDLEDIKLKLVQHLGEEPIPLNLWPSREKELPYKPFIDEEAIEPIVNQERLTDAEMKSRINELLFTDKMKGDVFITTTVAPEEEVSVNLEVEEDRTEEEQELLLRALDA